MKSIKTILTVVLATVCISGYAQDFSDPRYAKWGDTPEQRRENILNSTFLKESIDNRDYAAATGYLKALVEKCPTASENIYVNGIRLYKNKIARAKTVAEKKGYVDSLMWVYDLRNQYFGSHPKRGTVYILDRKARELLTYDQSDRAGISTPAVIIVGKVCALADELHWAEDRPLGGRQFLLTRPRQNISSLAGRLRDLGAQVIEMPAIHTEAISPNEPLKCTLERFGQHEGGKWLVFTSPIGVNVFFDTLKEMKIDLRSVLAGAGKVRIGAIGSATAEALCGYGLIPDAVPETYSAGELGKELAEMSEPGEYALIARAEKGSPDLIPPLTEKGLFADDIPLNRTVYEVNTMLKEEVMRMLQNGEIDAVTFTSASTVRGFVRAMGENEIDYGSVCAVCIGEQTARAAAEYGMQIEISDQASMDAMVEKILELFGNRR